MTTLSALKADLAKVGESRYSETKQTPGRNQYKNQLLGVIGSEGISDESYVSNSSRIIRRGKQRRPKGYWETRMTTSGLNYSTELMSESTLNVSEPSMDVAAIVMDDEEHESDLFKKAVDARYQSKLDEMQGKMTATTGNSPFQIEKKMDRLRDRLKTEMP